MKRFYLYTKKDVSEHIVLNSSHENIFLEFKKEINFENKKSRGDLAEEFACDICQFANSFGGVILIGVVESEGTVSGLSVATGFFSVGNSRDIKTFINDKVRNYYYPTSIRYDIVTIKMSHENNLMAINIYPLSDTLAGVSSPASPEYIKYPFRTALGKKYMRPYEIEERMYNRNRSIFLRLSNIWKKEKVVQVLSPVIKEAKSPTTLWDNRDLNIFISDILEYEFQLKINDQTINIPYGLLREVWNTFDDKIGIIIDAQIIISSDRKSISLGKIGSS